MHNLGFALEGAGRVLAVCLVLGAGLPALFALGVRVLAGGGGAAVPGPGAPAAAGRRAAAYACFAVVALAVVLGIAFIVASGFGMALSFEHVVPTLVDKH